MSRKMVTEMCGECMHENNFEWDVKKYGWKAYCNHCGAKLLLCDECLHAKDNPGRRCTSRCLRE